MVSAVAVPWRRRNDDDTVVSAQATPERSEGVAWADTRQRADTEEVLGAETPSRSWIRAAWGNFKEVQGKCVSLHQCASRQKSPAPCEFTNRVQDTAFGEEGCDGKRRRKP